MKKTQPGQLVLLAAIGGVTGWFLAAVIVAVGGVIHPPLTLGIALGLIGIVIVAAAWPVWRVVRKVEGARVDPFYATRVVLLAKSASLGGSLVGGITAAVLAFQLTRSVVPSVSSLAMTIVMVVGAIVLLVGGLIAERMCTLPPDDDKPESHSPSSPRPGRA
jgi:hypothetical protein